MEQLRASLLTACDECRAPSAVREGMVSAVLAKNLELEKGVAELDRLSADRIAEALSDFLSAYRELIGKLSGTLLLQHLVAVHYERLVLPLLQHGPPSLSSGVLDLITSSSPCTLSPERLREVVQHACRRAAGAAAGSAEQASCLYTLFLVTNDLMYPDFLPLPAGSIATPGGFGVARAEAVRCGALESVAAYLAGTAARLITKMRSMINSR